MSDRGRDRADAVESQRVFVALWPSPGARARLAEVTDDVARQGSGARRIVPLNLHLTLAFIGSLREDRVADLALHLERCEASEFDWVLDHVGYFHAARVLWAGGPENSAVLGLAARVRVLLDRREIEYDHKPFVPHVTLLRNVARWAVGNWPIDPPIVWPGKGPTLVRSKQGATGVSYVPYETR